MKMLSWIAGVETSRCPPLDRLSRSLAWLIWPTPTTGSRHENRGAAFGKGPSPEPPGAACPADGIPIFFIQFAGTRPTPSIPHQFDTEPSLQWKPSLRRIYQRSRETTLPATGNDRRRPPPAGSAVWHDQGGFASKAGPARASFFRESLIKFSFRQMRLFEVSSRAVFAACDIVSSFLLQSYDPH